MEEYLEIGKILKPHGVKGEVKILNLSECAERYDNLEWVYLNTDGKRSRLYIESVKYFKGFPIVKFKGINDVSAAESLRDRFIEVDRDNAIKLPEGSYFICDLIGSRVFDDSGKFLGELVSVIQTGSNDVYVVKNDSGKDILVPALKSVVTHVDIKSKVIRVRMPEELA